MNALKLESYMYELPEDLIAIHPLKDRSAAKLLVYHLDSHVIEHLQFKDFFDQVDSSFSLVLNNTQVLKARFYGIKNEKRYEIFYHQHIDSERFYVQIRGKVKPNDQIRIKHVYVEVLKLLENGIREVIMYDQNGHRLCKKEFLQFLDQEGFMPIPPYLKRDVLENEEQEYQNPFAKYKGAVAAPTASLHFSDADYQRLKESYELAFVTLHVGAGTFMGVEQDDILKHVMHAEEFDIPPLSQEIFDSDKKLLAVGTTAMRVIEEYARSQKTQGQSRLFLNATNPPIRCHALLTNFHLPKSTLLMLVASLVGVEALHKIYQEAIKKQYRFYSYGDAMLIL